MLASMSEIEPRADAPLVDWSELGVSGLLPTGTVTLLLADVEGSTRLWETQPERDDGGDRAAESGVSDIIAAHDGVRPVEQGEGDSFVAAFARASRRGGRVRWSCSAPRWRRSGCASGCTPAKCSCATKATTPARPSTARRGCAIWATAARPCCRARPKRWCSTGCPPTRGCPIWAPTRCAICPARSGWCSCAIPIWSTTSRRCESPKAVVVPTPSGRSSPVSSAATRS